jgi:hypothetical protein
MFFLRQSKTQKTGISPFFIIRSTANPVARSKRYRLLWIAAAPGRLRRARKLLRQRPLSIKWDIVVYMDNYLTTQPISH